MLELTKTLHLGLVDADVFDAFQQNRNNYFKLRHARFWDMPAYQGTPEKRLQFRGEGKGEWIEPQSHAGQDIRQLQIFLRDHGFMPQAPIDGVFDYWTLSSLRLFQEYVRTVEGFEAMGTPDGRVGNGTHQHMLRWKRDGLYSTWGPDKNELGSNTIQWSSASNEFNLWMDLLRKAKQFYEQSLSTAENPSEDIELFQLQELVKYSKQTDSIKPRDWSFEATDIHLIGLRCFQEQSNRVRGNDDLFVLLMNGMVFKFWGSTDPRPKHTSDGFEPYLLEGQHKYKLSWHRRGSSAKIYKALVPYDKGVLVFRDWSNTDSLTDADIREGLNHNPTGRWERNNPNNTINIHWTFDGKTNWSAGCQVISGRSYINDQGSLIDCSDFSAMSYDAMSNVASPGVRKTRGAYSFLSDFVYSYSRPDQDHVYYTLGRDGVMAALAAPELLQLLKEQHQLEVPLDGETIIQELVRKLKG